jgi:hypothetical protein
MVMIAIVKEKVESVGIDRILEDVQITPWDLLMLFFLIYGTWYYVVRPIVQP